MKSNLIQYTDRALKDIITKQILKAFPSLRLGDNLVGPVSNVRDGKMIKDRLEVPDNLISFGCGFDIENTLEPLSPSKIIAASTWKVSLKQIDVDSACVDQEIYANAKYLHPYQCTLMNREWLENYDVGDEVSIAVSDPETFTSRYAKMILTQEMVDSQSHVLYRFSMS